MKCKTYHVLYSSLYSNLHVWANLHQILFQSKRYNHRYHRYSTTTTGVKSSQHIVRCFTAGHLSCCLVLSTGRTLLLLQTEWCHSPAPTKTIKTVSIEFKFTRWHKVNSIREKCTWFNFLNSTTWVKMYSKICFASLESWGKFDVTPRMSPHSLT